MKNKYVGFTQGFHTESLAVIDEDGYCEFYPRGFNPAVADTNNIAFYERPYLKKTRQLYAGQYKTAFSRLDLKLKPKRYFSHHLCHAATAFQQSNFSHSHIVVADSVGEWETITQWSAWYDRYGCAQYKKIKSFSYPMSIGLFYSSITQLCGFKPNAEEGKLMELSKQGELDYHLMDMMKEQFLEINNHRGCLGMYPGYPIEVIARCAQETIEYYLLKMFRYSPDDNNCFAGGVAFNSLFVENACKKTGIEIYVPPNPGDPGSAIGAAALLYGRKVCSTRTLGMISR